MADELTRTMPSRSVIPPVPVVPAHLSHCPFCHEAPHQIRDCSACWDPERVMRGYLQARVALTRLVSCNLAAPGMAEVAHPEALLALNPEA